MRYADDVTQTGSKVMKSEWEEAGSLAKRVQKISNNNSEQRGNGGCGLIAALYIWLYWYIYPAIDHHQQRSKKSLFICEHCTMKCVKVDGFPRVPLLYCMPTRFPPSPNVDIS